MANRRKIEPTDFDRAKAGFLYNPDKKGRYHHFRNLVELVWRDSPIEWNPWLEDQIKSLCDDSCLTTVGETLVRTVAWTGPGAAGKAQPLDCMIQTPIGPIRMGDVSVGTVVCTPDGLSAAVSGVFPQGEREVFRVTLADGSSTECCREHLWEISDSSTEKTKLVDTEYLIEKHVWVGSRVRRNLSIPFTKPVFLTSREVTIHPYLMGALLGNGMMGGRDGRGGLGFSSIDQETIERVQSLIEDGLLLRKCDAESDFKIVKTEGVESGNKPNPLISKLKSYGLWGKLSQDKHIPEEFRLNSLENRLELIRGMLDTDGGVRRGNAEFYTSSETMANQMTWLIQSVGGTCRVRSKIPTFTHNGEKKKGLRSYTCAIQIKDASILFHLSRKKESTKLRRFHASGRTIQSVKSVGVKATQCIQVDHPRHLYLTDSFIPTHNTYSSGLYAMAWFLCAPERSSVALCSTSKMAMGGRIWAVIKDLFISAFHPDTGEPFDWHIINSRKELQWPRGDEKHSISCFAVEEGELLKSIDKIKGRHTDRMLLIVDESNSTPDAIYNTIPNQLKGCKEHVTLTIGNAVSFFDNHGRACEPKDGWNSITVDCSTWNTKGVQQWRLAPGICRHYDGSKSPNALAGKTIYPHIYSFEDWQEALKWGENSMHYWSQDRGFWAPEGTVSTVFSDPLINRCDGQGFLQFYATREVYAFLDPGFGGDRCVLKFADVGELAEGKVGIQLRPVVYIEPKVMNESERDYQIARTTIEECKSRGVKPNHFGSDATAIGRGVHAIISGEWSPEIHRVEWGGKASDKPSSQADGRPAVEVYANQVTELWFAVREFLEAGQLKGLGVEEIKQACSREYEQQGRRYLLNSKPECKKKLGYSPDEMDATAGLCEVVKLNGINAQGKIAELQSSSWDAVAKEAEKELALVEPEGIKDAGGWADKDFGIDWRGDE